MSGRHRRAAPFPFWAVAAVLVAGVAAVLLVRAVGGSPGHEPSQAGAHITPSSKSTGGASPSKRSPRSPPPSPHRGRLVIHGAGDTNVDPSYIRVSPSNYSYMLSGMNGLFVHDDLTIVNLECAVTNTGSAVPKEFNFRGDPNALPYLKRAGVDVANMSNNHSYDYGPDGLVDTRRNIERAGLAAVGAGKDAAQAEQPAIFHVKGWTIAVVGIDKVVDPYPEETAQPGHPGTACGHDVGCMVAEVRRAAKVSDLTIVDIHWGVELDTQPRSDDVAIGKKLVNAGADIIFGGHSHRLQPVGSFKGKPIFYSLGNFVWPHLSVESATTEVAEVVVKPNGNMTWRAIPAYISSDGHPELRG